MLLYYVLWTAAAACFSTKKNEQIISCSTFDKLKNWDIHCGLNRNATTLLHKLKYHQSIYRCLHGYKIITTLIINQAKMIQKFNRSSICSQRDIQRLMQFHDLPLRDGFNLGQVLHFCSLNTTVCLSVIHCVQKKVNLKTLYNKKVELTQRGTCNSGVCLKAHCKQNLSSPILIADIRQNYYEG